MGDWVITRKKTMRCWDLSHYEKQNRHTVKSSILMANNDECD